MVTSCYHCGCAKELHRAGQDECVSCSCLGYLDPATADAPAPADDPGNLDGIMKFRRARVRHGERLRLRLRYRRNDPFDCTYQQMTESLPLGLWVTRGAEDLLVRVDWDDVIECRRLEASAKPPPSLHDRLVAEGIGPGAAVTIIGRAMDGVRIEGEGRLLDWHVGPLTPSGGGTYRAGVRVRVGFAERTLLWKDIVACVRAEARKEEAMDANSPAEDAHAHNLDTPEKFLEARVPAGKRLHLGVVGNHVTDEARFLHLMDYGERLDLAPAASHLHPRGIVIDLAGQRHELLWGDIIECWPLADAIDPRYADGEPPEAD